MRRVVFGIAAIAALIGAALAEAPQIRALGDNQTSPPATVADINFLAGHWIGDGLGACAEELIAAAAGGQIMGMFRQMAPEGGLRFYEFYTFAEKDGSLILRIKHFNPEMSGWEEKNETVDFPLVAIEGTTAYFDGLTFARKGKNGFAVAAVVEGQGVAAFEMRKAKAGEACEG